MARANRHFVPGYIWHITHRCHKREFLLKFARDRTRWVELLFESIKRFHISVLNFTVTSNHIHLIVSSNSDCNAISRAMQLMAGRVGQEYNRRKGRKGAFWEDRYHATAIESGDHLWRCIVYVDLNMVRAGMVEHPADWRWCGYHQIQQPKHRYRIIDHSLLRRLFNATCNEAVAETHLRWVVSEMRKRSPRQDHYSSSLAVGSQSFIERAKDSLGIRAKSRRIEKDVQGGFQLREKTTVYKHHGGIQQGSSIDSFYIPWKLQNS